MNLDDASAGRFTRVSWVARTGSTNADVLELARQAPTEACVLFADEQTEGRGRRDRRWEMAPAGGLLVSFFVPWTTSDEAHVVPTALGVAAVEAIARFSREVFVKWPNDIVAPDDKKVGGMLSEALAVDGDFAGVVVGLGCNVSWPPASTSPVVGLERAVSLDALGADPVDRTELARALIAAFDRELDLARDRGVNALHDRYRARCSTLGRMVRIERRDSVVEGVATDVSADGALLVSVDGVQRRVDVGDVVHLRPAPG